jgi:hypothetical protein
MKDTDWRRKLTSRKFWAAIISVFISICVMCGVETDKQERMVAVITSSATLISYIISEGMVDKEHKDE